MANQSATNFFINKCQWQQTILSFSKMDALRKLKTVIFQFSLKPAFISAKRVILPVTVGLAHTYTPEHQVRCKSEIKYTVAHKVADIKSPVPTRSPIQIGIETPTLQATFFPMIGFG